MVQPSLHDEKGSCKEAKLLMVPILLGDPGVSSQERTAFEAHLAICPDCRAGCKDTRRLMALIRQYAGLPRHDSQELPPRSVPLSVTRGGDAKDEGSWRPMTVAEGWEDLKQRSPSLAEICRRQQHRHWRRGWFRRIGSLAAAASILIAIGIGWWLSRSGSTGQPQPAALSSTGAPPTQAFAELVTPQGRRSLALDQPVTTDDQPQEILLGGMHRVVMNRNTTATFMASPDSGVDKGAAQAGKTLYEVQLARGELYVEVVPGHPFLVRTGNARLEITGTKFDVRVEGNRTELVLLKGSVRFGRADSPVESVDVTAGCISAIVGQSRPSAPRQTDALAATTWARDLALTNAIAIAHPAADPRRLDSVCEYRPQSLPPDLDSIDYQKWRDEHRDWFAREFPWIFQVQEVLKEQHSIDADYIELLMVSGDIWQFNYPRPWNQPIPVFSNASLRQIADHYSVRPDELQRTATSSALGQPAAQTVEELGTQYFKSLRLWQSEIAAMASRPGGTDQDLLMFTLRAGTYLTNTRTAAWVWSRTFPETAASLLATSRQRSIAFPYAEASGTYQQWLGRLKHDAATADRISQAAQEVMITPKASGCEIHGGLAGKLAETAAALLEPEVPQ